MNKPRMNIINSSAKTLILSAFSSIAPSIRPTTPWIASVLVALFLLVASHPGAAYAWSLRGDLTAQNQDFANAAAGAVSRDMNATGTFLRLGFAPDRDLALELSWNTFQTNSSTFAGMTARADADVLLVGASWTLPTRPWFQPFARVGAGIGTTAVSFEQGVIARDSITAPALAAGVGFELLVPRGSIIRGKNFTLGFLLEFGWMHVFSKELEMTIDRATTPATDSTTIAAGALGWSAFTTRFGLVIRL